MKNDISLEPKTVAAPSMDDQIKAAAKRLEDLLNLLPNQLGATITKTRGDGNFGNSPEYRFDIKITSTHPVQIYP